MSDAAGNVTVRLHRGRYFQRARRNSGGHRRIESPLLEPLRSLGLDTHTIRRLLRQHSTGLLGQWVDITLAAQERFGPEFFKRSPAAFFIDNLRHAAAGTRTPPDWWHQLQQAERQKRRKSRQAIPAASTSITTDHPSQSDLLTRLLQSQFEAAGQTAERAVRSAQQFSAVYCESAEGVDPKRTQDLLRLFS